MYKHKFYVLEYEENPSDFKNYYSFLKELIKIYRNNRNDLKRQTIKTEFHFACFLCLDRIYEREEGVFMKGIHNSGETKTYFHKSCLDDLIKRVKRDENQIFSIKGFYNN